MQVSNRQRRRFEELFLIEILRNSILLQKFVEVFTVTEEQIRNFVLFCQDCPISVRWDLSLSLFADQLS